MSKVLRLPRGPVSARWSSRPTPTSGESVMRGGTPTLSPEMMRKSTALSLKPSPVTGAAYHQLRS
jgi:hypothetical protein